MSGNPDCFFVDTNVLLYSIDRSDPMKHALACQWMDSLWSHGSGRLSWQVLNEFYVNAAKRKVPPATARGVVETLTLWHPVGFSFAMIERGWHWSDRHGVAYWDSLILAAAEVSFSKYLLTEDLQAGQRFGDVTVLHPFRSAPEQFFS